MFLNDCCHAGAPIELFTSMGVDPEKLSFIGAVTAKRKTLSGMTETIIRSWQNGRIHEREVETVALLDFEKPLIEERRKTSEVRWGKNNDPLFFPIRGYSHNRKIKTKKYYSNREGQGEIITIEDFLPIQERICNILKK